VSRARSALRRARQLVRRDKPPKQYRYVFVVTYGRSGSTLVQGLLNTLPRTVVRGENNLYVLQLYRAMASVQSFRKTHLKHNPRASHSAFYGLNEIKPASFVASARPLVTGHLLGSEPPAEVDVLGFKEVLWHRVRATETEGFFDFLDRTFPGCLYVLNEREHERVVESGFWQSHDRDEAMKAISRIEEIQQFLRETRPRRTLDLRYELLTSDDRATSDAQLRALAEFVHTSCDDELLALLRQTRETGHGPFPFGRSLNRGDRDEEESGAVDA
jgi:hypothetical protein